jgi:hypothetical protein
VQTLLTAGYVVFAINPLQLARYRSQIAVTDLHYHRKRSTSASLSTRMTQLSV